jgi:hypothetical protein
LFACQYAMIRGYIFEMAGYDLGKITGMVWYYWLQASNID